MRAPLRTVAAVLALLFTVGENSRVAIAGQRPLLPRDPGTRPPISDSSVAGRVFDAITQAPLRGAQVQARSQDRLVVVDVTTDDQGRYELAGLAAGEWQISAWKGGYFPAAPGQRRSRAAPPATIKLAAQQQLAADFPLTRGGVITGRVYDDTGEPLSGLRVRVYRARTVLGQPRLESVGIADFTDDRGAYRIYGLPPGDYIVAASLRVAPLDQFLEDTYSPTYFPGTGDVAEAQRVTVGPGSEVTAIFSLLAVRFVRVSGSVLTSDGAPANAFISLTSEAEHLSPFRVGGVTRADGTFTVPEVPPGRYVLGASLRSDGPAESASLSIAVGNNDVGGVTLVTSRPASLRGRIVADAGVSRPLPQDLIVLAVTAGLRETVLSSDDGPAFELGGLTEPFYLRVDDLPDDWAVKHVFVNETNVTDAPIALSLGLAAEARIVLTDRATTVTGTVSILDRSSPTAVVVFPEDRMKWTYPSSFIRVVVADGQGRFRITGLPPGEPYLAVATDDLEYAEQFDHEFLARMSEVASRFQLEESATRVLNLTLIQR
jgi:hypothetical protein